MAANSTLIGEQGYDRAEELKQFDDSKLGVKGLVDSGLSSIPRIFIHPPETLQQLQPTTRPDAQPIPTSGRRSSIVHQVSGACRNFGFFQITNHGIPSVVLDRTIAAVKAFHEQPPEVKARFYRREMIGHGVAYLSNVDLYTSKAASWRDTLLVKLGPLLEAADDVPKICRDEIVEWDGEIRRLGEELLGLGLVSEGLGLRAEKLKEMTCLGGRAMAGHYYPPCPQPDLTVGLVSHSDPGVLTVLLQDHIGGLQVKHDGAWVDVKPVPGALVINVGDVLQIISNEEYKSVDDRVLANPHNEARLSIAVLLNPSNREGVFGPFPELVSPEKPALYKEFKFSEFLMRFFQKELNDKSLVNYFKLH
ncbi:1-aminocyclopropane-1-carboxylate oxidase homolog 4-like [Rosa rugosa]|uniref:1-aminocyclopropane-1-carboxylate oxidase homolog 4-like n=1 Tax=Rosa rugosa TaxID=74645 RepID=UPI002B414A0A|nr:1-aminocyclopropane-1-carboxylate oxidase homolog 4-like [Rosa rugosa]XP_061994707.1 1-aminocyclopropane-1-carboxylate oxidase homolog 4-like [Rosa rugosa]